MYVCVRVCHTQVSHAPSLTHLTVSEFDYSLNEAHRDTQWAVQSLYMRVMKTSEMAKLPRPASDSVRVRTWEEWPVFLVTAEVRVRALFVYTHTHS